MGVDSDQVTKRQTEIFKSIQDIQTIEQDLYTLLNDLSVVEPGSEMQKNIINQIDELSKIRISMLKDLTSIYSELHVSITDSKINLHDQKSVTDIINNEVEVAKKKYKLLADEKNSKKRMTEINTYHGKKYNAHANVMKTLLVSCILVLILTYVIKKELLPQNIVVILIGIVIFFAGLRISLLVLDIMRRDNMNYDKFNWDFTPPTEIMPKYVEEPEEDRVTTSLFDNDCVGEECCSDGMIYDRVSRTCIPKEKNPEEKHNYLQYHDHESHSKHIDEAFTKGLPNNSLSQTSYNVKPYNS
jgi:hypothetical protein